MASGTKSKGAKPRSSANSAKKARRSAVGSARKPKPWGMIIGAVVIVALAAGVFTYAFSQINEKEKWIVSADNKDPSVNISGVIRKSYKAGQHINANQRVAYDNSPPYGGPHDNAWAECNGTVYPKAVRTENMVHSMEHGAVWITFNPDKVKGGTLDTLKAKVEGQPYMLMSPYPGLDKPISLQSWGHRLTLTDAKDPRMDEFIKSVRQNQYQSPEPGGRCDVQGTGFDVANPPPFVAEPPGPDAVDMNGKGAQDASKQEQGGMQGQGGMQQQPPATGATPPATGAPTGAGTPPPSQ